MKSFNPLLDPSLDGKIITDKLNGRFMTISGVTPIVLAGNRNGQQGLFVSKPGYDVRNATDAQLIFNSNQDVFKVLKIVPTSIITADFINSGNAYLNKIAEKSIDLNPYGVNNPIVWTFMQDPLGFLIPLPYYSFNYDTGALQWQAIGKVDPLTNTAYISVRSNGTLSPGVSFLSYILQETAS